MLKGLLPILYLASCILSFSVSAQVSEPVLKVMTFNIRYDNPADSIYSWDNRKEIVYSLIREEDPAITGLQEVLANQLKDLKKALHGYGSAGVGRDDGISKGEFSPIMFQKTMFRLEETSTFWLSETPSVPGSISWNAACTRIVTWARLRDKKTGATFFFFNTHFDHVSEEARVRSAQLLLDSIRSIAGNDPVILTGDFNCTSSDKAYRIIANGLDDCRSLTGSQETAFQTTFIGFPADLKKSEDIDHIFLGRGNYFTVRSYQVLLFNVEGKFPSDHLPVIVEVLTTSVKK
jgi:endonuclease/exonuclease/phosphatase family metal-dependent hydrolase